MMPNQKYRPLRSEEDGEDIASHTDSSPIVWSRGFAVRHVIINLIIFSVGLVAGWLLNDARPRSASDQLAQYSMVPSPAFEAISSQPLTLTHHDVEGHGHASPYQGYPTPERTARWMDLMNGYSIRVPSTSLDALNIESIPLNDDSGDVWVSMNVYHHLHCLDSIRHQVAGIGCKNPHDPAANHTEHSEMVDEQYFPPHIDHCIETLRKRLICQPDLGVRGIAWNPDKPGVAFANNTVDSACVNWDAVQDWTRRHSFTEEERLITTPDGKLYRGPRTPPARCGE
ncbi:hypothetical protein BU23DRAFT_201499 [Bimuria novae-zelandiae CBS 107.79]|uniref:Tat pathway signal sequence n=1 Tax=Bimuria novae-zelandiae CBS 107.79 TaxID=1447943 RepID=A0A6A5V2J1_9PLEO|nr:hypothetical protein BU23DRAFT_201499 [Bimuria novae-zelandiae CBS 107.79]